MVAGTSTGGDRTGNAVALAAEAGGGGLATRLVSVALRQVARARSCARQLGRPGARRRRSHRSSRMETIKCITQRPAGPVQARAPRPSSRYGGRSAVANHTGDEMLTVAGDRARRADEEKRNRERRPMATRVGIGGPQGRRLARWWVFPRGLGEKGASDEREISYFRPFRSCAHHSSDEEQSPPNIVP